MAEEVGVAGERLWLMDTQLLERAPSLGAEGKAHGTCLLLLGLSGALLLSSDVPQHPSRDRIGCEDLPPEGAQRNQCSWLWEQPREREGAIRQ